ncbi:MAG: hypothetical protein GY884_30065, partial [Proteobacteria bacterium]|nr:hypothetical protein [Pseudomonadota bacterium]
VGAVDGVLQAHAVFGLVDGHLRYDADANALLLGSAVVLAADSVVSIAYTIPAS